jgi:hypothetical protein
VVVVAVCFTSSVDVDVDVVVEAAKGAYEM